jgi:hypothetical protein
MNTWVCPRKSLSSIVILSNNASIVCRNFNTSARPTGFLCKTKDRISYEINYLTKMEIR